jgi:predicted DNA binding CopG/RHH family protein
MPPELLRSLKAEAARVGIPYQTYLKGILAARPQLPKAS